LSGFHALIGRETGIDDVSRALYKAIDELRAPVVGAMQVTCADESEREVIDAFQHSFAEHLLPSLKFGERAVFRIANLGARYEKGAVRIADDHYAGAKGADDFMVLVIKINSHVAAPATPGGRQFGKMERYGTESAYCGALNALLHGSELPFADDFRSAFASGGKDRLPALLDRARTDPETVAVIAAVINTRLQAERALEDVLEEPPPTPTRFFIISSVTLNRRGKDTEIVCGIHDVDYLGETPTVDHNGLGDDPAGIRVRVEDGAVLVTD
jgi:hypothetical protein